MASADGDLKPSAREKLIAAGGNSSFVSSPFVNNCNNSTFKVNVSLDRNIRVTAYGTDGALSHEAENHIKHANELLFYSDTEEEYHYQGGK